MKILFTTFVRQSYKQAAQGFTRELFERLTPKFPPVRILRYDGCAEGDEVHMELQIPALSRPALWVSRIAQSGYVEGHEVYSDEWYFIDEGVKLPFFLKRWRHLHRVVAANDGGAAIIDDIEFSAPWYLALFVYPVLYIQFAARQPIYKEYFQ
jgi:ligand-binding SRPBCC domain-containing protein